MADIGYKKNVGLMGSISLLVCSITGPGMVLIPMIYQDGGFILTTAVFLLVTLLSGISSLFVVESISRFPGNEQFERNVEFTVMIHQFYGRKVYYCFLMILYGSLQTTNIVSIIGSAQIFDSLFIGLFGATCGYGISPIQGLYCVTEISNTNSPFGDNYMLGTLGLLVVTCIIIPMTSIDLNDNMFLQFVSFLYNVVFALTLVCFALGKGVDFGRVPSLPRDASQVVGQVLYNFVLANTVPSWLNVKHDRVSAKSAIWGSLLVTLGLSLMIGYVGGITYQVSADTNLLQAMYADKSLSTLPFVWISLIYIAFPVLAYITSVPVAMIVSRLNFQAAGLLSFEASNFCSVYVPFLLAIPFQTGAWITSIGTYSSLTFHMISNFVAPFVFYLFLSRRNLEMAQSVLDELEFLGANVTKAVETDDQFDYIYHLPTAPIEHTVHYNTKMKKPLQKQSSLAAISQSSRHSIQELKGILDPNRNRARRRRTKNSVKEDMSLSKEVSGSFSFLSRESSGIKDIGFSGTSPPSIKQDILSFHFSDDQNDLIDVDVATYRAMPEWMYDYISPNTVAVISLVLTISLVAVDLLSVYLK